MSTLYIIALFLVFAGIFYFVYAPARRVQTDLSSERIRQLRKLQVALANPAVQMVVERMVNDTPPETLDGAAAARKKLKYDLLHAKLKCLIDDKQTREQVYLIIRERIKSCSR